MSAKARLPLWLLLYVLALPVGAVAQQTDMQVPHTVVAGAAFSIATTGSGQADLYIVGPGQAIRHAVRLGEKVAFPAGELYNAGSYLAILRQGTSSRTFQFNVVPAGQPGSFSFLAEPSRLPVSTHNGINGTAYIYDAYHNLILVPVTVSFRLSHGSGGAQQQSVTSRDGVAWTRMSSSSQQGEATFTAVAGSVSDKRIIDEVPGDPCNLTVHAQPSGGRLLLQTDPIRDCSGNPVPDGTVVTFTETLDGRQSTADIPIKRGIARVEMPAWSGALISVASGAVAGNQIRWRGRP
ncbi:MAG TPA: hypothetical protein VMU92_12525 [Acidobacteriaceae bacterium]|nr:hypothetical protein [Acidobacteriaceae bacterium]